VYHHCLLGSIYEVGYCAKESPRLHVTEGSTVKAITDRMRIIWLKINGEKDSKWYVYRFEYACLKIYQARLVCWNWTDTDSSVATATSSLSYVPEGNQ